jgi:hypothetical protein
MIAPVDTLEACIDAPRDSTPENRHVLVRGWCYARGGSKVLGLRARVGRRIFEGKQGLHRPDVAKACGGIVGSEFSGFEVWVEFPRGESLCEIEALVEGSGWLRAGLLEIKVPKAGELSEAWRGLRFWWLALRGRPEALKVLKEPERSFLLNQLRLKGWTNLDRQIQYSPKTVGEERFPRGKRNPSKGPKISLVTPSLNQAAFLERTMCSVLEQDGVRLEYSVQDGASHDGSPEIIERVLRETMQRPGTASLQVSWESKADKGQAEALLRGFSRCSGSPEDLMGYLNSDDKLMPGTLRFVADYFAKHPETDAIYGHRVMIDEADREIGRWLSPRPGCNPLELHDFVPQESFFWRRRIWDRVGGIDPSFHFALDWDLLLRFRAAGARIDRLPWFLGLFRVHTAQKSQSMVGSVGMEEMDKLRQRTLGHRPTERELHDAFDMALLDSALVAAALRKGLRL